MQRPSIAARMRVVAGSPLTPFLSALAAAGVGCGRQQPASPVPADPANQTVEDRPDAAPDALVELFRDASPDLIAAQLEDMLDGAVQDASSDEASAPQPKPSSTARPKPSNWVPPTPRPIYRGVNV